MPDLKIERFPRYSVYWWDHDKQEWHRRWAHLKKWTLRRVLRRMLALSWDWPSLLVENEDE